VGTHSIIANYNGDSSYNSASSNTVTQVVNSYTSITYPSPAAGTIYSYIITPTGGASGYATNGNLLNFTDSVNGTWNNISYDNLNRLLFGASTSGYYQGLQINWGYDSFGNRTSESYSGSGVSLPISPTPQYNANNQVNDGSLGYDSAGNVIYDNSNQYLYDSEGRICAVYDRTFGGMTEYIYDAEGVRVAKGSIYSWTCDITQNSFSLTKTYVIGPSGEQLTETDGSGNWIHTNAYAAGQLIGTYNNAGLYFQLSDWLGTRRVETDYAGNTQETCTSLPFGNDSTNCVGPTEQFFTGKERDTESGNDYFGARYYASTMGRFTSPDPSGLMFADHTNPQSLNLYNYALNNPLQFIDPTGFYCYYGSTDADVSDPSQYDFHSKKAECTAVDENGNQGRWIDDPSTTVTVHANGSGSMDTTDIGFDGTIAYVNINHSEWTGRKTPPTDPCSSRNGRAYGPGHYARDYHLPANGTPIPAPEDGLVTGGRNNAPHIPGPYNYSQAAKPGSTNYTDFTGGSGYILRYVHTHPAVPFNSPLSQGQTMATSDMSGRTTGPHTHVQATDPSGARVDPNTYFSECH
jgi:RHS repeat-associated protein